MSNTLKRNLGTKDVLAMAFGTMIGWGWIMLSGSWAESAGMLGAILAFAVGAVMCIFVGIVYAELTPALPYSGGSVAFAYKAMGIWPAAIAGLATSFSFLGVAAWEGPAFASAIDYLVRIPRAGYLWTVENYEVYLSWAAIAMGASVIITVVNIMGSKAAAVFQTAATAGLLIVGVLFAGGAVAFGSADHVDAVMTDAKGFLSVMLMVPAMFVGFDVIPHSAGEMNVPLKKIPGILILSILGAAAWYMLMIFATCFSAPQSVRAAGEIPVADAMAYAFGSPVWGKICIIGALLGILTSWNGFLFGAARCLASMAQAGMLPGWLGVIHPRYRTPHRAILFCGVLSTLSCLLGSNALSWFVNASSFSVVVMYGMTVLAFLVLRKRQPELPRPYRAKHGTLLGICAAAVVVFFLYLYLPAGPSSLNGIEWGMVLVWFILGALLVAWSLHRTKDWPQARREESLLQQN